MHGTRKQSERETQRASNARARDERTRRPSATAPSLATTTTTPLRPPQRAMGTGPSVSCATVEEHAAGGGSAGRRRVDRTPDEEWARRRSSHNGDEEGRARRRTPAQTNKIQHGHQHGHQQKAAAALAPRMGRHSEANRMMATDDLPPRKKSSTTRKPSSLSDTADRRCRGHSRDCTEVPAETRDRAGPRRSSKHRTSDSRSQEGYHERHAHHSRVQRFEHDDRTTSLRASYVEREMARIQSCHGPLKSVLRVHGPISVTGHSSCGSSATKHVQLAGVSQLRLFEVTTKMKPFKPSPRGCSQQACPQPREERRARSAAAA